VENNRKKPKTKPTSVSLSEDIKAAAQGRADKFKDGNLTAYIEELIKKDVSFGLPPWAEPFEALLPRIRDIVRDELNRVGGNHADAARKPAAEMRAQIRNRSKDNQ
jgi:hypothetical protein